MKPPRAAGAGHRQAAQRRGQWAEIAAAWCLRLAGYRILARNVRTPLGEIDIVARRGSILAIVEVKARPAPAAAMAGISHRGQRRIARAATWLVAHRPALQPLSLRFDLVAVAPWRWPTHVADAWRPPPL